MAPMTSLALVIDRQDNCKADILGATRVDVFRDLGMALCYGHDHTLSRGKFVP